MKKATYLVIALVLMLLAEVSTVYAATTITKVFNGGTGVGTFTAGLVGGSGTNNLFTSATTTLSGNSQVGVTNSPVVVGSSPSIVSIVADSIGDTQLAFNTGQNLTTASSPTFAGLTVGSLSGIIKGSSGVLSATSNGTDYTLITALTCGAGTHFNSITAAGVLTCSADTGSGGSGLATTTPISGGNVLVYTASGAGFAYGVATSSLAVGTSLSSSGTLGSQVGGTNSSLSLNLTNPNNWTGLQTFTNASSSLFSVTNKLYVGGTATTTIDSTGNIVIPSGSNLTVTGKSDGCATWATGVLNSTGSACGSGGGASTDFTYTTNYGIGAAATSTNALWGQKSIFASSTSATVPALAASNSGGGPALVTGQGNVGIGSSSPSVKLSVGGNSWFSGSYNHFGSVTSNNAINACSSATCFEFVDTDNTTAGVVNVVENVNNGTSAYTGFPLLNDLSSTATTNYSGVFLNSSTYSDTTFGTLNAVPNLLQFGNSMGPVSIQSFAPTQANSYINFFAGSTTPGLGPTTSGEGMRLTSTGLGIGTTSPFASLSVMLGNDYLSHARMIAFAIGSTTAGNATTTLFSVDSSGQVVASSSGAAAFSVGENGATNPAFQVDASNTLSASGVKVYNLSNGNAEIDAMGTSTTVGLTLAAKGGSFVANAGTSQISMSNSGTITQTVGNGTKASFGASQTVFTQAANNTAANTPYTFTGAGESGSTLTASTESTLFWFNFGQGRNHATGAIPVVRDIRVSPPIDSFAAGTAANNTIASSTTFTIDSPPGQGTLANITNAYGLFVNGTTTYTTASTTNSYGAYFQSSSGATNNYAFGATGSVILTNLTAGAGNGALCASTAGLVSYDAGANCIISTGLAKYDVVSITDQQADEVLQLNPVQYKYYSDGTAHYGFIAEDAFKIDPKLVTLAQGGETVIGAGGKVVTLKKGQPKTFDYERYVGLLTAQVQKQAKEIEQLQVAKGLVRSAEENWQWLAIGLLVLWNLYLTFKRRK